MATRLRRLQLMEVALVDQGDNPGAPIVIAKRKEQEVKETEMPFDINKLPEEFRKSVQDFVAEQVAEAVAKAKVDTASPVEPEPEVTIPDEVQKRMDLQSAEIAKLRRELDERSEAEAISKAKVDYSAFTEAETIGKALHKLSKVDAALHGDICKMLASAQAIAKKTEVITKQIGQDGTAPDVDPEVQIEKLAVEILKANPGMKRSEVYEKVLSENADLYKAYASAKIQVVDNE